MSNLDRSQILAQQSGVSRHIINTSQSQSSMHAQELSRDSTVTHHTYTHGHEHQTGDDSLEANEPDSHTTRWKKTVNDITNMPPDSVSSNNLLVFQGRLHDLDAAQAQLMQVYETSHQSIVTCFETILDKVNSVQAQMQSNAAEVQASFTMVTKHNCQRRPDLIQRLETTKDMISYFQHQICYQASQRPDGSTNEKEANVSSTSDSSTSCDPDWQALLLTEPSTMSRTNIQTHLDNINRMQDACKQLQQFSEETQACFVSCIDNIRAVVDQACSEVAIDVNAKKEDIETLIMSNNDRRQRIAVHIQTSQGHLSSLLGRVLSN